MTRYSVTGVSRELEPRETAIVNLVIAGLDDATEISTGCAHGVDTAAHLAGLKFHPRIYHRLCIPAAPHNDSLAPGPRASRIIIDYAPKGFSHSDSYMNRNERLVRHADILLAFPETDAEELRSGTWATIRRARRAGVGVEIHPLNGHSPEDGHGTGLRRRVRGHRRRS